MHFLKCLHYQSSRVYATPAEVVEGAACSPVKAKRPAVQVELGVELVEGGVNGLWVAGSWLAAAQ